MKFHKITLGKIVSNCYLIEGEKGFVLVDTGRRSKLKKLLKQMSHFGATPESINLIIMTHGHFDHTGLGAYFQKNYNTPILMHSLAANKVMTGDMFVGFESIGKLEKNIVNLLFKIETFTPDYRIQEGMTLEKYGLKGEIIYTPGHSDGSISILLEDGSLLCGDLFDGTKEPRLNPIQQNKKEARRSQELLASKSVNQVYPGHGNSFLFDNLVKGD